jgi:ribose transport system substrate-binding protein
MKTPLLFGFLLGILGAASAIAADKDGNLTIAFLGRDHSNPVYAVALEGARRAAADLGTSYAIKITVEDLTPASGEIAAQAAAIDGAIKAGVDGITLTCADRDQVARAIDRAVAAGIPVATFNSDAPNSQRFFAYVSDNDQCGQTLFVQLVKTMGGKGTIGILAGNADSEAQQLQILGAKNANRLYPGITIKGVYHTQETTAEAVRRLAELTRQNPDITGWLLTGSWPLTAPNAFPWAPGAVKCGAVGLLGNETGYLKDGHVQLAVSQPFYQWGYRTVERLGMRLVLNRKPADPLEYAALVLVTPTTVGEFERQAAGWNEK